MQRFTFLLIYFILIHIFTLSAQSSAVRHLEPVTVSANTADKPQAKVWFHQGKYWTVLPNHEGTFLWRLDGTTWTKLLQVLPGDYAKADCKAVDNLVHILLFRENNDSYLVSLEYEPALTTYKLWEKRPSRSNLNFPVGVETASIEIDGNGRMWVAFDDSKTIYASWSDSPYSSWSPPVTIATGVNDDDICGIIALPALGKIGILWSNLNTKRFGFKTHADATVPTAWSEDEVPASQSFSTIGGGMADDHLNMTAASDGTLYCAIKTAFDTPGYTKIGLLIRRPQGTWDDLYKVSGTGTRPIILLNESIGKLRIVYTSEESGGDILSRESPVNKIIFGSPEILLAGLYNYASTSKGSQNASERLILATNVSSVNLQANGLLVTDVHALSESLIAYPNPFSEYATISFALPETSDYSIGLYDNAGRQVTKFFYGSALAGTQYKVNINASDLANGVYIARLKTRDKLQHIKLVLHR